MEQMIEMTYDSDVRIKMLSLQLAIDVMDLLKPEFKKKKLVNMFRDKIANLHEDEVLAFSKYCGPLYLKMVPVLEKNNMMQLSSSFLTYFRELANSKVEAVRRNFLFNLPGVLSCTDPKYFMTLKHNYFKMLEDKNQGIRTDLFVSLHEVLSMVSEEEVFIQIRPIVIKAMRTSQPTKVSEIIGRNLVAYVAIFAPKVHLGPGEKQSAPFLDGEFYVNSDWMNPIFSSGSMPKGPEDIEFIASIPSLWKNIANMNNWRLEHDFLDQLEASLPLISANSFVTYGLSFVWQRLKQGNKQIKARCIMLLIQTINSFFRRDIIKFFMKQMTEQFLRSKSHQDRLTYLLFTAECFNSYSRELLRTYFFLQLLELEHERVSSVKLSFVSLLSTFRLSLVPEEDSFVIEKINYIISSWLATQKSRLLKEKLIEAKDQIRYRVSSKEVVNGFEETFHSRKAEEDLKLAEEVKDIEEVKRKSLAEITKETSMDALKQRQRAQVAYSIQTD